MVAGWRDIITVNYGTYVGTVCYGHGVFFAGQKLWSMMVVAVVTAVVFFQRGGENNSLTTEGRGKSSRARTGRRLKVSHETTVGICSGEGQKMMKP